MPAPQDPFASTAAGSRRLTQFRVAWMYILGGGVALLIGLAIAAAITDPNIAIAAGVLGGTFCFTGWLIGAILYFMTRRGQRIVDAMVAGDHFVHWVYPQEEWEAHLAAEQKRRGRLWLLLGGIMGVSGLLIALFATFDDKIPAHVKVIIWIGGVGGMTALGVIIGLLGEIIARRHAAWMRRAGGEAFIGDKGFYICGAYWPWNSTGIVHIGTDHHLATPETPAQLAFTFRISAGRGTQIRVVFVPVPRGLEKEAAALHERLRLD